MPKRKASAKRKNSKNPKRNEDEIVEEEEEEELDEVQQMDKEIEELKLKVEKMKAKHDTNLAKYQEKTPILEAKVEYYKAECKRKMEEADATNLEFNELSHRTFWVQQQTVQYKKRIREMQKEKKYREGVDTVEEQRPDTANFMPTCEKCQLEYSEDPKRTPRMLECGHAICEKCVEKIAKKAAKRKRCQCTNLAVPCPFEGKMTVIKEGKVHNLPRNYGLISFMDAYKKDSAQEGLN